MVNYGEHMLSANKRKASPEYRRLLKRARAALVSKGWSTRRAATYLERNYVHLSRVLTGERVSELLLIRVLELPASPVKRRMVGFARNLAA